MAVTKAIECDGCGITGDSSKQYHPIRSMRKALKTSGWISTKGQDFCPERQKDRTAEALEGLTKP
jgi:hypothetical protein